MRFAENFIGGHFFEREVSTEELQIGSDPGAFIRHEITVMRLQAKYLIHRSLIPTDAQMQAWIRQKLNLHPWQFQSLPPSPWDQFTAAKLPEPAFAGIQATGPYSLLITMVFGGVLKERQEAA